jgi:hypothetical protein
VDAENPQPSDRFSFLKVAAASRRRTRQQSRRLSPLPEREGVTREQSIDNQIWAQLILNILYVSRRCRSS